MRMKKITGNFLTQSNRDFPLDCETLDYLQSLSDLAAVIGNIGGDRVVLMGCELRREGAERDAGYVFVRSVSHPEGEVMYWEGGATGGGMYVKEEDVSVTANNIDYPKAYTIRSLAPGVGGENYSWDDFADIKPVRDLMDEMKGLRERVNEMSREPLGIIAMWSGMKVPEGYLLCNGQALRKEEYPELYDAIGDSFNEAMSSQGAIYRTAEGYFRVPDLRGRFVVGQHDSDEDYMRAGAGGGLKRVALTEDELPGHSHGVKDYYHAESGSGRPGDADNMEVNGKVGSGSTDYDNTKLYWVEHNTENRGGGGTHENRPPYYVLAYIMRCK